MENGVTTVEISKNNYKSYVFEKAPKSAHFKNMALAFVVGGIICVIGQLFIELYLFLGISEDKSYVLSSATMIFIAALMTGIGIYDKIGRFAGAGSTIPITGFSNAMVSPALEFRSEGLIYGLGAKMFLIAGPVVVNGVTAAVIIAIITLIIEAL